MAYSHRIPLISAAVRDLIGSINESLYLGVFSDVRLAANTYLYTFEHVTGTTYNIVERTVGAGNVITGGFNPFGSVAAQVSGQDYILFSCENDVERIFIDTDQAAAYGGGVTPVLEIKDSTNGASFNRTRTISSDGSSAMRNSGVREIALGAETTGTSSWSPGGEMLGITARRWYRMALTGVNAGGCTAAPRIARMWLQHTSGATSYLDLTASANGDLTTAPASNSFFPAAASSTYYATVNQAIGEERYLFRAQAANRTRVMEFLTPTGWQQGTVTDPSNDFTAAPTALAATPTKYAVTWTPPATWAALAPPFTLPAGAAAITTAFWRRIRTDVVTTLGPMDSVQARTRARQYGNANTSGVEPAAGTTLKSVTVESISSISGSGPTTLQLANLTTGVNVSFDIPASPALPLNVDTADLALAAGQRYGLFYTAGAVVLRDVAVILHT